ncbi:hypothetical protein DES53_11720 [Roseimicrobium gellanilyticum]|uniref:MoxR-vWA-beta-propeller ternary system domain-containing protein n=1 Tax=Roseimicrobium gellanilyticum TaxID=748857 RepID=A0A366H4S1_9BACT|nr:hypothetical protein [Roseimicrobium gellanilyticum]RBP36331.1 hypothetical protein DES53_11720 [Roseimicrobium gellanilyticum]
MVPPGTASPLAEFASGLFSTGKVVVRRKVDLTPDDPQAVMLLHEAYQVAIDEWIDDSAAPEFQPGMALEALRCLYRLCHALVDRALSADEVEAIFSLTPTAPANAAEMLSADVVLRHLPALQQWAKSLSSEDPLLVGMPAFGMRFPLSSVGMGELPLPVDLTILKGHQGLWQLYIDRVIERQDASRLTDPEVKAAVRDALGSHSTLAPRLALAATA